MRRHLASLSAWHERQRSARLAGSFVPPFDNGTTWSTSPPMPAVLHFFPSNQAHTLEQSAHRPFVLSMACCLACWYSALP